MGDKVSNTIGGGEEGRGVGWVRRDASDCPGLPLKCALHTRENGPKRKLEKGKVPSQNGGRNPQAKAEAFLTKKR